MPTVVAIDAKAAEELDDQLVSAQLERPFAQDTGQLLAVLSPGSALSDVILPVLERRLTVGVGLGAIDWEASSERISGAAVTRARRALRRSAKALGGLAVDGESEWTRDAEAAASVLADILHSRSDRQREVVTLRRQGLSAEAAAEELGITRRAVHKHLVAGRYLLEVEACRLLDRIAAHASGEVFARSAQPLVAA